MPWDKLNNLFKQAGNPELLPIQPPLMQQQASLPPDINTVPQSARDFILQQLKQQKRYQPPFMNSVPGGVRD